MTYSVILTKGFLKQFRRLPRDAQTRIKRRVEELAVNPYLGLKLSGQLEGLWKDRVGQYRIIYEIDETSRRIIFHDADLRKRVYD